MSIEQNRRWLVMPIVALLAAAAAARAAQSLPEFDAVEKLVRAELTTKATDQPGGLLVRSDVERVLNQLRAKGWDVADRKAILAASLDDNDRFVKRFRTPAGSKFLGQVAGYPDGYDRLDRLQRLPDGERILDRLISGPDGFKLLEYLTEQQGGREMGKMLSNTPQGKDFNRSTGRIYTAEQLLKRLEQSYQAAQRPQGRRPR